jgi:CSLREA domain-containing protein
MKKTKIFPIRIGLSMFFGCLLAVTVNAANFTVDSNAHTPDANPGDGVCADAGGLCTLRAAIQEANALAGADTINFDPVFFAVQRIILLNTSYVITDSVTINGTSPNLLILDGNNDVRIFNIDNSGATVSISNLTIENGYIGENSGAGIRNAGNLMLSNIVFRNNEVNLGSGGAISNSGSLNLSNSTLTSNFANSFGDGAGIANSGSLTISNTTIENNEAVFNGGGISNSDGVITITNSIIRGNTAGSFGGGGISNFRSPPIGRTPVRKSAEGIASGTVIITNSTISDNAAIGGNGGGIYNQNGEVNITSSTIGSSTTGGSNRAANGGGIYNVNGGVALTNSTVSGNFAGNIGGGYYGFADLGAATLTTDSATIAFNTATNGGGVAVSSATGLNSAATIGNTIISDNIAANGPDVSDNSGSIAGTIVSTGYNIVENTSGAAIAPQTGDQFGVDPLLLPLANNGGATETHALSSSSGAVSPAIDKGNTALTTDQRGFSRPVDIPSIPPATLGDESDIGAFEIQSVTSASVFIQGRVLDRAGRGVSKARLVMTETDGTRRFAVTNPFGYYRFDNIKTGQIVVLEAAGKGFVTQTRVLNVNELIENLDFIFDETKPSGRTSNK